VAILLGAASVYFCWLATRELAPRAPIWAIASAGTVALLPEFCFTNAHAANDSAVNLAATAAFYVWIRGLRHPEFDRRLFGAGAMLGLAFLCKLTAAVLVPGLVLVILFRMFQARPSALGWSNWLKRALSMIAGAALGTVLVCGWWFVRNIFTYGEPSGTSAEVRLVAGNFIKADFSDPRTAGNLLRYTLESLWGRFERYYAAATGLSFLQQRRPASDLSECPGCSRSVRLMAQTKTSTRCRGMAGFIDISRCWTNPLCRLHPI
jgi:4-amino-4-deoxy-L-arabinose transferase-like glycosyltransferase